METGDRDRVSLPAEAPSKVLLIDGSRFNCLYFTKLLEEEPNLLIRSAADVDRAFVIAEDFLPTVTLLSMEQCSGPELAALSKIREHAAFRDVPLIAFCGIDTPDLRERAEGAGADALVLRSPDSMMLVEQIHEHSKRYIASLRHELPRSTAPETSVGPARVLMIDDSKMVCMAYERRLQDEREVVFVSCSNPAEALEEARRVSPTVILLDLEMPVVSGFDLLPKLRQDPLLQDVPIIVLSGITDPTIKARAFKLGADDYAEKQMDETELISRIQYHTRAYVNAQNLNRSIHELIETQKHLELQRNFIRKTFGRYLSDEIVANILETPEGMELGGEKREISIMMADLRGFTSISERLAPEKVLAIINNFLKVMTEILFKYHGTINEFLGDAILAMFGAPLRRDDNARRAVACAVEMQLAMKRVNKWNRHRGYPEVAMGIGINTGEVVVGNIGSERRAKYGIVGRHVNLTSRIEGYTVGDQIMVSESTAERCGPILRIDGETEIRPKGIDHTITIYEVGGIGGGIDLFLPEPERAELPRLRTPLAVALNILEGKQSRISTLIGRLTRLRGKRALLEAEEALDPFTDIKLKFIDSGVEELPACDLYAKVMSRVADGGSAEINFTSVPPEAEAFLRQLMTIDERRASSDTRIEP